MGIPTLGSSETPIYNLQSHPEPEESKYLFDDPQTLIQVVCLLNFVILCYDQARIVLLKLLLCCCWHVFILGAQLAAADVVSCGANIAITHHP